jgi:signal transduction histidine kinase
MTQPVPLGHNGRMRIGRAGLGTRWEAVFDVAAAITVVAVVAGVLTGDSSDAGSPWLQLSLLATGGVLLALRRRFPTIAALGSILTSLLALLVPATAVAVWVLAEVCLFSLPLRSSRVWAIVVGSVHAAVLYLGAIAVFQVSPWDPLALILPVWTGAVIAFGSALRTQQDYVVALEDHARTAAAARENEVLRYVSVERLRIARDLHDSVANSIAVINLESSNARRHVTDDPDRTVRALGVIRAVTRSTLIELSGILAVLRDDYDDSDRTVATAANIPHLLELLSSSGMPVHADLAALHGLSLEPASDSALYRIAQESLTNAHRHGSGPVRMLATLDAEAVTLTVANDVNTHRPFAPESGFGLIGMRERVEFAGGTLTTGEEGQAFVVRARLPIPARTVESGS